MHSEGHTFQKRFSIFDGSNERRSRNLGFKVQSSPRVIERGPIPPLLALGDREMRDNENEAGIYKVVGGKLRRSRGGVDLVSLKLK